MTLAPKASRSQDPAAAKASERRTEAASGKTAPLGIPRFLATAPDSFGAPSSVRTPRFLHRQADDSQSQAAEDDEAAVPADGTSVWPSLSVGGSDAPEEREARAMEDASDRPSTSNAPPVIRRRSSSEASGAKPVPEGLAPRINRMTQGGEPLAGPVRQRQEQLFQRDFSSVRIHRDAEAADLSKSLNARAWTLGDHIAFAQGRYAPSTAAGHRLLAHELTHVVQQGGSPELVQRNGGGEAESEAGPDEPARPGAPQLDEYGRNLLQSHDIDLTERDQSILAEQFPNGFDMYDSPVYVTAVGDNVVSYRAYGIRVVAAGPVVASSRVYIMRPESKGRSILISSTSGQPGHQLDAGAGQAAATRSSTAVTNLVRSLSSLVSSGQAAAPAQITVSHVDVDHYNAVREQLTRSEFSNTTVRVATELISGRQASGWTQLALNVNRSQRVVEVQVTGGGGKVHVDRQIYDGFVLTEFRSVEAHQAAQTQNRYAKNATSPVSVVIDRATGDRFIFTADAQGRQFTEIVEAIGERAFRRLIGGSAGTLRAMEYPHHGGLVSTRANIQGAMRMMWFVLEASGGRADIFTQTSQRFSQNASDSLSFLELAGVPARRTTGPDANTPAGQHQADRLSGDRAETITYDAQGVRRARDIVRQNLTPLQEAFAKLAEVKQLRNDVRVTQRTINRFDVSGESAAARSLDSTLRGLETQRDTLRLNLQAVRTAMENAAGTNSMRRTANMATVTHRLTAMTQAVEAVDLTGARASLGAVTGAMDIQRLMMANAMRTMEAGLREDFRELRRLAGERRAFQQRARRILGNRLVQEHIQTAWRQVLDAQVRRNSRVIQSILTADTNRARAERTAVRAISGESLARQMALHQLMADAQHGRLQPSRPIPARTRAGAGFLALIEVARIGLEGYSTYREASERAEINLNNAQIRGLSTVNWWKSQGIEPRLALISEGFWGREVVQRGFSQSQLDAMVEREIQRHVNPDSEAANAEAPDFPDETFVVVEDLPNDQVRRLINSLFAEVDTLDDFERWNNQNPEGPTFRRFEEGWGVRQWDTEDQRYKWFYSDDFTEPLDELHGALEEGTQEELDRQREGETVYTVEDSGIIRTLRYVYVYNRNRTLRRINFGETQPQFIRIGTRHVGAREYAMVRAVDLTTYRRLYTQPWMRVSGGWRVTAVGAGGRPGLSNPNWNPVYRNSNGYALVEPDELE